MDQKSNAQIKTEFKRAKIIFTIASFVLVFLFTGFVLAQKAGVIFPRESRMIVLWVIFIAAFSMSMIYCRCPNCNRIFGKDFYYLSFCSRCGVELR